MNVKVIAVASALASGLAFGSAASAAGFDASGANLDGSNLRVDIIAPQDGWAVVHKMENGRPAETVAQAEVKEGENPGVTFELAQPPADGEELMVMLHEDKGTEGSFDEQEDTPALRDGNLIVHEITLE